MNESLSSGLTQVGSEDNLFRLVLGIIETMGEITNMAIQVESDLKDILLKLDNKLDKLDGKIDQVKEEVSEIKISVAELKKDNQRLEEKIDNTAKNLEDKISATDKKIDSTAKGLEDKIDALNKNLSDNVQNLSKRVDNSDFINRGIFISLVITILGGFASFLGLIGKP